MRKEFNYYRTNIQSHTIDEWLKMLQEENGFTSVLIEALYVLIFEMGGKGSAKQISEITGRSYQVYNLSMSQTVNRLRKKGYQFSTDIRTDSKKERYWSQFFNGYYHRDMFVWEVKESLQTAFIQYDRKYNEEKEDDFNNKIINENKVTEGKRRQRVHYQIERNSQIVNIAKKNFIKKNGSLFCEACNFSFNKTYGIDFIEAHHILPLYKGERITKERDLIMLCANCHRAIHSKNWNNKSIDHFIEHMKNK